MVVVVDDSAAAISQYEASVRSLEVDIQAFRSADDAYAYLRENPADLLFLDIVMPKKDGFTLLRELRALPEQPEIPVVVVTSKDYAQDRALARDLGAREFLLKPLRSREIRSLIERHTGAQLRPMSEDGDP